MKRRATVTDVAKLAGVGGSTVSRYLRGIPVRPYFGERIARAVQELGYTPDETARALRLGRTKTLGMIVPRVSNPFFSQAVQCMEAEVQKHDCTMILLTHQDRMAQQSSHLATLLRYKVDGVILTAAPGTALHDVRSALPDVPMVAFDAFLSAEVDSVFLDNRAAASSATEHLLQHGYTRIACVTAKEHIYSYQERIAGYSNAMARHKRKAHAMTAPDYDALRLALKAAIQSKNPPDALLALSDIGTLHVLRAFDELGMKREEHLPLVGFDDTDFAALIDPPITVMRQPIEKMVRATIDLLFQQIDGAAPGRAHRMNLPGELICRRSCGCP